MSDRTLTRGRDRPERSQGSPPAEHDEPKASAIDPRMLARRIEVLRARGRRRRWWVIAVGVVLVLVLAGVASTHSALLDVDAVTVRGAVRTPAPEIAFVAGIPKGREMVSVDTAAAARRVKALPWIASVSVRRSWPGTVRIRVVERRPVAIVTEARGPLLVDRSGHVLGPPGPADGSLLHLVGPRTPRTRPGGSLDASWADGLAIVARLPSDVRSEVTAVGRDAEGSTLVLIDGIRVDLCGPDALGAKLESLQTLLVHADRPTIATVNLCVPNAPALTRKSKRA